MRALTSRLVLFAFLAAVMCASPAVAADPPLTTINVASMAIDSSAEAFYAADMGFFKKNGLDVKITVLSSGSAITAAVAGGAVDIGFSNLSSVALAHKRNLPLIAIAPAGMYLAKAPTAGILVGPNSTLKTAKDLNGKTIGVNGLHNISQYAVQAWIDDNGGDSKSVKFIEMPNESMEPAVATGRLDAVFLAEPQFSAGKRYARVFATAYDAVAPSFVISVWLTTNAWAAAHPDLVKRFAEALHETALWANANQAKSGEILSKWTKVDMKVVNGMTRTAYGDRLVASQLQPVINTTARYGEMGGGFPASELILK